MSNLSKNLRDLLKKNFYTPELEVIAREKSIDNTEKFLFKLKDGSAVETVLIPEKSRSTLCVSTQVGCKFKCSFCASGEKGFKRNLEPGEIIGQYLALSGQPDGTRITNIVFMGIGEPLDNFDNSVGSIAILTDPDGVALPSRRISISTCGLVPEIRRLAKLKLGVKLSISLHSADNRIRDKLMPVNKKYPLDELIPAVGEFSKNSKYPVTFEYVLIRGVNSGREDAKKLAKLLNRLNAKANLMLYNGAQLKFKAPSSEETDMFLEELKKQGAFFTLRKPRGRDINAACGQLKAIKSTVDSRQSVEQKQTII